MLIEQLLSRLEKLTIYLQGKGGGSGTVKREFRSAVKLLENQTIKRCVDIGGNKGTYAQEVFAQFPKAELVIFEPAKSNFDTLAIMFANRQNVTVEHLAVSDDNGDAVLYSEADGSGLASLTKRRLDHFGIAFENAESVKTTRFEDYWNTKLNRADIDLCKIDIEGHELDALRGMGTAIDHIKVIQFEFGGCNIDTRTYFQDFWYFFNEHGFEIYRISPFGLLKIDQYRELDEVFLTTNYLAKRSE